MDKAFFETWLKRKANFKGICFLCGINLTKKTATKEHVFPKWLHRKFGLRNLNVFLVNRTTIPYRKLTVPCCKNCNGKHLSKLENVIKLQADLGYESFIRNVSKLEVYQWCLSIFYKMLLYETFLKANIREPNGRRLVTEQQFSLLELNHLMLRSIDKEIIFDNFFPGSIFICNTMTVENINHNFYYTDNVVQQLFCIRMNDIGIIAVLNDGNAQMSVGGDAEYKPYLEKKINPAELKYFYTKCLYRQSLFNDPYQYYLKDKKNDSVKIQMILKEGVKPEEIYQSYNDDAFNFLWKMHSKRY